jgi:hypothetical protein
MKTLRTIATVLLAAFMVLAPLAAVAAGETVTVATNSTTYAGASVIQVTGTVSPAPASSNTAVVVTTKGPSGVVDTGPASVATGTGAYSYTFVAGGSTMWTTGTYTVNATYGGPGGTGSATSTFTYTASSSGGGSGLSNYFMSVSIQATTPVPQGGAVGISVLTSSPTGTLDDVKTWSPFHIHYPDGTLHNVCQLANSTNCVGTLTRVHTGFYYVNFTLASSALTGLYSIHAGTTDANGVTGEGLGTFTVVTPSSSGGSTGGGSSTVTTTVTVTSGTGGTSTSSDAAALAAIQTQLGGMSTTLNGISTGVSGITNTLSGLSTGLANVAGMPAQLTALNNSVNNDQTYVLVVAALAAITLVLELAILVRKLS